VKVCFLCANHPPEAWGGTEQLVVALARELRALGVEVVVISGSDVPHSGTDVVREEHDGVTVHRVFKLPDEWDHQGFVRPRILAIVRELLRLERPDVLHVHSTASLGVGITPLACEAGVQVVMTFHDLWVTCARYFRVPVGGVTCPTGVDREPCVVCIAHDVGLPAERVRQGLAERDRVLRAEVMAATVCTAPSATAARYVRDCLPHAGRIEVIPHGLLRPVAADERAAPPRADEVLRVGTFGGLVAEKGVLELLDAAAGLPCELHLSGRVYHDALRLRIEAAQAAGRSVVLHGPYTPAARHPARDLHLAVFPSKCQETYGLVVDEALAHGVPAVVSDAGALRERAGTGGVVVTPIGALANVLRELVGSPERLAALRARIPTELPTIAASARRHLELYSRLR
jgi:glycosyltransferase involved in cell wall biosynthesis